MNILVEEFTQINLWVVISVFMSGFILGYRSAKPHSIYDKWIFPISASILLFSTTLSFYSARLLVEAIQRH